MTTQTNGFLPDGYEAPKGGSNYFKPEKGENRVRILSKPILGWIDWHDKKPIRYRYNAKPAKSIDPAKPVRHFWAMIIWNYRAEAIQIMEITQATIQQSISSLAADPEWGNPYGYDIKITRTGESLDTSYSVNPSPHKPLTEEIQMAIQVKGEIKLERLYDGGDPFEPAMIAETPVQSQVVQAPPSPIEDDMPF